MTDDRTSVIIEQGDDGSLLLVFNHNNEQNVYVLEVKELLDILQELGVSTRRISYGVDTHFGFIDEWKKALEDQAP